MINYYKETYDHEVYSIFPNLLMKHIDEIRSGDFHKGKFISIYLSECRKTNFDGLELELKHPQFVSQLSTDRSNNWLDFVINMDDAVYQEFKKSF